MTKTQNYTVAITATFTAEPVLEALWYWDKELGLEAQVTFAPYNQVFQQLLDPASLLSRNEGGCNVVLVRFEDWLRKEGSEQRAYSGSAYQAIERNLQDLMPALESAAQRSMVPYLVCMCPASPAALSDRQFADFCRASESRMARELSGSSNLQFVSSSELMAQYPVAEYDDPQAEQLGHIPYTAAFYAGLGTLLARRIYGMWSGPHKVIVLDCDQTLWGGVCGEVGAEWVELDGVRLGLQQKMVRQHEAGMLLCLCSKNNEEDVWEVFGRRSGEMVLRREHLAGWRINWGAKSENLKSLAEELGLGLESFIFIDDDAVACAEVRANCPEVLTLQLPGAMEQIPQFLEHVWAFDRQQGTREDQLRTSHYRQNVEREQVRKQSLSFADFLESLELKIKISELSGEQVSRVAQLTQRTNQFNCTTVRRREAEVEQLSEGGWQCEVVEVSDRFGDYGLVGVMIYEAGAEGLRVETLLLSCRALGRGVEQQMVRRLGQVAQERGLSRVDIEFEESKKNQPAREFLESIAGSYKETGERGGDCYRLPAEVAVALCFIPDEAKAASSNLSQVQTVAVSSTAVSANGNGRSENSEVLRGIASELCTAEQVLRVIEAQKRRARPEVQQSLVAPRNPIEEQLAKIWTQVIGVDRVGTQDDFFELGGHSLLATVLMSRVRDTFQVELSLDDFFNAPTISGLVGMIEQSQIELTETEEIAEMLAELNGLSDEEVRALLAQEGVSATR